MDKQLEQLKQDIAGQVILPSDAEYDKLRVTMFNPNGKPAVIARVADSKDTATAIRFAKENNLVLSVRSGGHNGAGLSTNEGGVVIDLGLLKHVEVVDETNGVVRLGAGAHWGEVGKPLYEHDLAITAGDTVSVGVGGLTLGAGIGWMVRKFGLAIDNVRAAEIVTADGQILRVSDDENPDLFWAIRGGGGNFGVVTWFEFQAQHIGDVVSGTITYDFADCENVLKKWAEYMRTAPEELTGTINIMGELMPGMEPQIFNVVCYAGDDEAAANKAIAPMLEWGKVLSNDIKKKPYYEVLEEVVPPGAEIKVRAHNGFIKRLDDEAIEAVAEHYGRTDAPIIQLRALGGAMSRVGVDATAFAYRDSDILVVVPAFVPATASADEEKKLVDATWAPIKPFVKGSYLNFFTDKKEDTVATAFPPETLTRLAKTKAQYDPENIFSQTANIKPAM